MAAPRHIRAVSFDVGGTLLEPWPSVGHVYAAVAGAWGVAGADAEELDRRFAAVWAARGDFDHSRSAWREIVARTFAGLCDRATCESFFPELYARFARPEAWRLFPDVIPTLAGLRQRGQRLAVISNWDERLPRLLTELELAPLLDAVIVSAEIGCRKPAAGIFEAAARRLDVAPGGLLHVGDSAGEDVAGARRAGCHALRICRSARPRGAGDIGSLREVAVWLDD